ncbi:MAG: cyclodeaminase/cyclohydrolase family protein [Oscillospiraceae bacterium]|nr:cyclodeaminase/cyclohydrolase family protein [Oscillospiraceae bacterium]
MADFLDIAIKDFVFELSSKAPVPGGGGASALAGALGAALGNMVCSLTVGKKKYRDVEEDILKISDELGALSGNLLDCINEDAVAFEPLSRAYSIPKEDPSRQDTMEKCLRDAASVPFRIVELSCQAIPLLEELAKKGSRLAVSDAATGAVICRSAIMGAAANVYVNTSSMVDREYAKALESRTEHLVTEFCPRADSLYEQITAKMKNK